MLYWTVKGMFGKDSLFDRMTGTAFTDPVLSPRGLSDFLAVESFPVTEDEKIRIGK